MTDIAFKIKSEKLSGVKYKETYKKAQKFFATIKHHTKRKPYIRSAYFKKDKIFFDHFWWHIRQKFPAERARRLRYLPCAVELIESSRNQPQQMINPNKKSETLYRFTGVTKEGETFYVQIKEHRPSRSKQLMSVFPGK